MAESTPEKTKAALLKGAQAGRTPEVVIRRGDLEHATPGKAAAFMKENGYGSSKELVRLNRMKLVGFLEGVKAPA